MLTLENWIFSFSPMKFSPSRLERASITAILPTDLHQRILVELSVFFHSQVFDESVPR
ncbi:hypothetical protein HanIR_Chr11g0544271 [Helianthus annuus]|nr:hypothetical protein HanIR_Chr11g0544271 [Helianthus annuus]